MIDFEAIIRCVWVNAIKGIKLDHARYDMNALDALSRQDDTKRRDTIRDWLQAYRVFRVRGIATQRDKIADAVLRWADSRDRDRNLDGPDALSAAHEELMKVVCDAYIDGSQNSQREFTSLTSKALWLCYPDKIPMFDSYTQRALWVLAKLEIGIAVPPSGADYYQFVYVWTQFYERYLGTISALDTDGYTHLVRVFDRILLMIGKDQYTFPTT
jgi:hypothetical protein